jgi:uncharacterized membrane protein
VEAGALAAARAGTKREIDDETWSRVTLALDLVAVAGGIGLQRAFRQRHRERLPRAAARTSGYWLSVSGTAGAVIGGLQEARGVFRGHSIRVPVVVPAATALAALGEYRRRQDARNDPAVTPDDAKVEPLQALGMGVGVAAALSAMSVGERALADLFVRSARRVLPVDDALLRPLGHAVALGVLGTGARLLAQRARDGIEHKETSIEAAFDIPPPNPLLSGSYESHVPFATISKQGRRFVWTVTRPETIAEVTGEPAIASPIRAYAGLASGDNEAERVALVLDELERTGAFDRKWLLVASPTGTGYVNYAAIGALELLARGDCATVAMQYAARPSVLSLDRVYEGREHTRLLLEAVGARLAQCADDRRPKLLLFGESLGAWTSQDAFVDTGTQGLVDAGIDHAIWIGTPHFSKWKEQVLFDHRDDVDPALLHVANGIDDWRALSADQRAAVRYVMITHDNDGVALFGPEIAIQAPEWLGEPATRPRRVPKSMRWMPSTTFFQVLVDMKNSANVVPGKFAATGHDYRADLLPFFDAVLGFDSSPDQLARIAHWLEQEEAGRAAWIAAHGATGKSLAVSVVERAAAEMRADGADPDDRLAQLIRDVANEEFLAGGGATANDHPEASG